MSTCCTLMCQLHLSFGSSFPCDCAAGTQYSTAADRPASTCTAVSNGRATFCRSSCLPITCNGLGFQVDIIPFSRLLPLAGLWPLPRADLVEVGSTFLPFIQACDLCMPSS